MIWHRMFMDVSCVGVFVLMWFLFFLLRWPLLFEWFEWWLFNCYSYRSCWD